MRELAQVVGKTVPHISHAVMSTVPRDHRIDNEYPPVPPQDSDSTLTLFTPILRP
jgi:hypothetical protein